MKILISNDDGIESPGILELAKAVSILGEVTVVAPHRERSTSGHSLTLHKPLRLFKLRDGYYSTTGTPADCVYMGIREVMKTKPDLILSGINTGANLGTDIYYSGTVAAAREGALMNIPSYAFSLVDMKLKGAEKGEGLPQKLPMNFKMAADFAVTILQKTTPVPFPKHTLLNINVPNVAKSEIKGIQFARQGFRYYMNEVAKRTDPRGKDYYWIGGAYAGFEDQTGSDCNLVDQHYVSIVPITIDCTHNDFYTTLKSSLTF